MSTLRLALAVALGLFSVTPADALKKPSCTPVVIDLGLTSSNPGGTGLDDFPVFVHYMINDGFPADDPSAAIPPPVPIGSASYPPATVQASFAPTGLFNQVWGSQGVTFVLVGMETCKYTLPALDPTLTNKERFPNPANNVKLALTVFKRYNATHYKVGAGTRPFRGLDLYIFWSLDGPAGYGVSPKFKTLAGGGQAVQTPGGVFIDGDCQDPSTDQPGSPGCRREFAHEAGHFFALCHCCNSGLGTVPQTATCITAYCPDVPTGGTTLSDCAGTSLAGRLMATNWLQESLTPCEITRALGTANQILK